MSSADSPIMTTSAPAVPFTQGPGLLGWDLYKTPKPVTCDDGVFTTGVVSTGFAESYTYGICSSLSTDTDMATDCTSSTMLFEQEYTLECNYPSSCFEIRIYPTDHAASSEATWVFTCANYGDAIITTASLVSPLPSYLTTEVLATSTSGPSKSNMPSATPKKTLPPTASSSSSSSGPNSSSSGISGGAIGGIVVGCTAGVAILLMLVFRKKIMACFSRGKSHGPGGSYAPPRIESVAYTDNSTSRPSEMSSERNGTHEIGTSSTRSAQPGTILELG